MSIVIYTYRDPYKLTKEDFFPHISTCPYFCASQTLANGLGSIYPKEFPKARVTTVRNLTEALFDNWETTATVVKQHADIDKIISGGITGAISPQLQDNLIKSFQFNRDEVFQSIRTMFELGLKPESIQENTLTQEQRFILEIYKRILETDAKKDFNLSFDGNEQDVDLRIGKALTRDRELSSKDLSDLPMDLDRLVIHGVHQFTPLMLRAVEVLSHYKQVVLLFNYQKQYQNIYQTWIDIYSAFDSSIVVSDGKEFRPCIDYPESYSGNLLADQIGRLTNGQMEGIGGGEPVEVLEFDNMTEFAGYVSDIFEAAARQDSVNPMRCMKEQIYAADSSANEILKIYFPEQFGERQFLDYPLGHFFLAIANMWDPVENQVVVTDPNDIKECFQAGILKESYFGELSSIYGKISALLEGCTSIDEMLDRLKKLKRHRRHMTDPDLLEEVSHISYYSVDRAEIEKLEHALQDLDEISGYFYEDFEKESHNFRRFYRRLKKYLQEQVLEDHDLGVEFTDIIRRVLARIEEVEDIDTSASFDCLKSTMSLYLVQETKPGKSANWIVRNFEQIDGDILRSVKDTKGNVTYHFACLSDEDICSSKIREFPWPLDNDFFEKAQDLVDWKAQVYVRSRKEYKNYKAYALLFGLEFNRTHFKLSYVRRSGEQKRSLYYMLNLLGARITSYEKVKRNKFLADTSMIVLNGTPAREFCNYDYYRFKVCRYRFLLESLVEGNTIYKDAFLLEKYLEVMLENQIRIEMQGLPVSETVVLTQLDEAFDAVKRYFPFVKNGSGLDIKNTVRKRILGKNQMKFPMINSEEQKDMMLKELFIHRKLSDPKRFGFDVLSNKFPDISPEELQDKLSQENLRKGFRPNPDLWCKYCSNKAICTAYFSKEIK